MIHRDQLNQHLAELLSIDQFRDYAPNGLQVQGVEQIKRIVTGVTASQALIDAAIAREADAIIVHHGYFWKNELSTITGMKYERIRKLITQGVNLFAYHLPLDCHQELGNNAQLGRLWQLQDITPEYPKQSVPGLVRLGQLNVPIKVEAFVERVNQTLNRQALHLPGGPNMIQRVAWCSGGAQGAIQQALDWKADVYISGEVSEQTTHIAQESGIHYLAAGHHATEIWGVKALAQHLEETMAIPCDFIDCVNPV